MNQPHQRSSIDPAYRPTLVDGALIRSIGTEAIGWAPLRNKPVYLDPVAAVLATVFDGSATTQEIIEDLCDIVDLEPELAKAQLERVLTLHAVNGLLALRDQADEPFVLTRHLLPEPNW